MTPFLLERIRHLTGGMSLDSNIKLVMNNATIGAQVAVAYAKVMRNGPPMRSNVGFAATERSRL